MLIPGKLYKQKLAFFRGYDGEGYTTIEPVGPDPSNLKEWVRVTPDTIMMYLGMEPDRHGHGGKIIYLLIGDKICQWWTHNPNEDFVRVP